MTGKVIAIVNPKGGTTKSTTTAHLSHAMQSLYKQDVLVIDTDAKQGTLIDWNAASNNKLVNVVGCYRALRDNDIAEYKAKHDLIFIDGVGHLSDITIAAIRVADFILITVQPTPCDVWGTHDIVELVKSRQQVFKGKPKAAFIITRRKEGTVLHKKVKILIKNFGLPVFKTNIHDRVAYQSTAEDGRTVLQSHPRSKAAEEIIKITKELKEFIK